MTSPSSTSTRRPAPRPSRPSRRPAARALAVGADVSDEAAVVAAVARIVDELGPPAVLVNNAGVLRNGLAFKMTLEDWDSVVDVNLRSAFLMSREAQRHMTPHGWGRIVNLSSIAALGTVGQANYSAAKAGLQGLTKTLALELGQVRRHRERGRSRLHRHRDDPGAGRAGRHGLRGPRRRAGRRDPRRPRRAAPRTSRTPSPSSPTSARASSAGRCSTWRVVPTADAASGLTCSAGRCGAPRPSGRGRGWHDADLPRPARPSRGLRRHPGRPGRQTRRPGDRPAADVVGDPGRPVRLRAGRRRLQPGRADLPRARGRLHRRPGPTAGAGRARHRARPRPPRDGPRGGRRGGGPGRGAARTGRRAPGRGGARGRHRLRGPCSRPGGSSSPPPRAATR